MIKISQEADKWSRCQSCYNHENLLQITVGLDDSNACGQSILTLCVTCKEELQEKLKSFNVTDGE